MTVKQAFDSICEDGIALGAGDYVDPEALEVASIIMAKVLRGKLVEVVRCGDCKHRVKANLHGGYRCMHPTAGMTFVAQLKDDDHCSYGEMKNGSETL